MNKKLLLLISFCFLQLGVALAQHKYPYARVNKELYVMISTEQAQAKTFKSELSHLNLSSQADAEKFFSHFNDANVSFDVHFKEGYVLIHLSKSKNWDAMQWASYFKTKVYKQRKANGIVDYTKK